MVSRVVIVGALIAVVFLLGPFSVPNWAKVASMVVLLSMGIVVSVKQKRLERRLTRTVWQALTRRERNGHWFN